MPMMGTFNAIKLTLTVMLSVSEESSKNGCKAQRLSRRFRLDSSHSLRMTAMAYFYNILFYGYRILNGVTVHATKRDDT